MDRQKIFYKSLSEINFLASILASTCPRSDTVTIGLTELMINAVEHGNLNISYDEKSMLITDNEWEDEVSRRLALSSNKNKQVLIEIFRNDHEITFTIADQGNGFDWQYYLTTSKKRILDNHGRGIAVANLISFDHIHYLESGNKVCATVSLK